jgi:hypothetical protein
MATNAKLLIMAVMIGLSNMAWAEPKQGFSLMTGLGQDVVWQGYNIAAQFTTGRWVFSYSHGWNIDLSGHYPWFALSSQEQANNVSLYYNWTTGGGFGYFLTDGLHVEVEVKAHNQTESLPGGPSVTYTNYTVGPGIFYDYYVGKNFLIQTSLRYWPVVGNSTSSSNINLQNSSGGTVSVPQHVPGIFPNINVGWTF